MQIPPESVSHIFILLWRLSLAFLKIRAHSWLTVKLSSTRTSRPLSTELLYSRSALSLYWCIGLFLPKFRTLHLPLLNLMRFFSAQLSSVCRSHWMAAQPSGVPAPPPSFVSLANLLRVHSVPSSRSVMNKLNNTGPSTDPWGPPLATGLQLDSAAGHNPLSSAIQPVLNPPHCPLI